MEVIPDNHRVKWTNTEIKKLLDEVKNKTPIYKIADKHKRTIGAIKFKLIRHAIELIEKKELQPKLNDISEKTNLSTRDILEGFKKLKFEIKEDDNQKEEENLLISTLNTINHNIRFMIMLQMMLIIYNLFIISFEGFV